METRWIKRAEDKNRGDLLERVLAVREIENIEEFLYPEIGDLHDPALLPDLIPALDRIEEAVKNGEKITVYSDYDCDGTLGAAILIRYLNSLGAKVDYYIPNRLKEGYGLNSEAIKEISARGTDLIITVDNGISAGNLAGEIKELGMDLIVTDHHEPSKTLPEALAVIDPKREDSEYPFRELCGAGVVFKLVLALNERFKMELPLEEYLQMAMIATVADIVPLENENRTIVKLGLESFNDHGFYHKGLNELFYLTGLERLTSGDIGYRIGPVINAAGRLGEVEDVMRLLLDEDTTVAGELFDKNVERTRIENEIVKEALKKINAEKLYEEDIIVVDGENWHSGVIGIVASRIQDYWHKPVIVIGYDENGLGRGSCRSVKGFNIFEALTSTGEVFESFGGHELAAGFSIERKNVDKMVENLRNFSAQYDMKELSVVEYTYDLKVEPKELSESEVEALEALAPFGVSNPAPLFLIEASEIENVRVMGKERKHLGFKCDGIRSVAFNKAEAFAPVLKAPARLLAKAEINCYNNCKNLQLNVKDIKLNPYASLSEAEKILDENITPKELYKALESYGNPGEISREQLVLTYNLVKKSTLRFIETFLRLSGGTHFTLAACLKILKEAGLIDYTYQNGRLSCSIIPAKEKKDLTVMPTYLLIEETNTLFRENGL